MNDIFDVPLGHNALLMGDSKMGKSASILPLVELDEVERIVVADFDAKFASLARSLCSGKNPVADPEKVRQKLIPPTVFRRPGFSQARAYQDFMQKLKGWDDLGELEEWPEGTVFFVDSLTFLANAIFHDVSGGKKHTEIRSGGGAGAFDAYMDAQESIRSVLNRLTSDQVHAHVLVSAHIDIQQLYSEEMKEAGLPAHIAALPRSKGKALAPEIPAYFNVLLHYKKNKKGERVIGAAPDELTGASVPNLAADAEYPIKDKGLKKIFELMLGY